MKIPKIIHKNGHEYTFVQICNSNMILYKSDLGFTETFTKYDLGLINNTTIDKIIERKQEEVLQEGYDKRPLVIYDRQLEIEKTFKTLQEVGSYIDCSVATVSKYLNHHWWYKKRYFIERGELTDE